MEKEDTLKTLLPSCQIAFLGVSVIYHSKIEAWGRRHFCQLEIDHVTRKPKEICQSTCGGAKLPL